MTDNQQDEIDAIKRTSRAKSSRATQVRRKPWSPPSKLDAPPAPEGFKHRWIRAEVRGFEDRTGRIFLLVCERAMSLFDAMNTRILRHLLLNQGNMKACLVLADCFWQESRWKRLQNELNILKERMQIKLKPLKRTFFARMHIRLW